MAVRSFLFGVPVFPVSESATLRDLVVVVYGNALTFYFLCLLFILCRFINARRRIVQPMIDQSNRAGESLQKPPLRTFTHTSTTTAGLIGLLSLSQYTHPV